MRQLLLIVITIFLIPVLSMADDYPGRSTYPGINVYETDQLNRAFESVIIIDVRSNFEFNILHIKNAVNVPIYSVNFANHIEALRKIDSAPIIFYDYGNGSLLSYKASLKMKQAKKVNTFAYDSGIKAWSITNPDKASLQGNTPVDITQLNWDESIENSFLEPDQFSTKVGDKTFILDIREPAQRGLIELFPYQQENISLNKFDKIDLFLNKVKKSKRPLLIYDQAGIQVRWLSYYLKEKEFSNYFFLSGGVNKFLNASVNNTNRNLSLNQNSQ